MDLLQSPWGFVVLVVIGAVVLTIAGVVYNAADQAQLRVDQLVSKEIERRVAGSAPVSAKPIGRARLRTLPVGSIGYGHTRNLPDRWKTQFDGIVCDPNIRLGWRLLGRKMAFYHHRSGIIYAMAVVSPNEMWEPTDRDPYIGDKPIRPVYLGYYVPQA